MLVRGWYRNLQHLLLGVYSKAPLSTRVLLELEAAGVEKINKSTLGKWHNGKSMPSTKNVEEIYAALRFRALKRKDDLAIIRINNSRDWLRTNSLSKNPQIRLIQYASVWANPSTTQAQAYKIIHMIKNKWTPTSSTNTMHSIDNNIQCDFNFPLATNDKINEIPLEKNKIKHRLLVPTDPTSIVNFLFSFCESSWHASQQNNNHSFDHDNPLTDWCIDLIGACLLVDRLHLALGFGSYRNGSAGIAISKRVIIFIIGGSYFGRIPNSTELKSDLKAAGYNASNVENILHNLVNTRLRADTILSECGASWDEITSRQYGTFIASLSQQQVF